MRLQEITQHNCSRCLSRNLVDAADIDYAVNGVLALPKAGRTTGPDHRFALYTMLDFIQPSSSTSTAIVPAGLPLLAKETHDAAISVLAASVAPHLAYCMKQDIALPVDIVSLVVKEMNSVKPVTRRAFCRLLGDAFWRLDNIKSDISLSLAKAVLPALENNLKTVAAGPLAAAAGPLEGYTAVCGTVRSLLTLRPIW